MSDLNHLRTLIKEKMVERGGGVLAESYTDAARAIGVSQPSLHVFLNDPTTTIKPETCIRLARYLELPRSVVLRMCGYDDIASLLDEPESPLPDDPYLRAIAKIMAPLDDDGKRAIVETTRAVAAHLKPRRPHHAKRNSCTSS